MKDLVPLLTLHSHALVNVMHGRTSAEAEAGVGRGTKERRLYTTTVSDNCYPVPAERALHSLVRILMSI